MINKELIGFIFYTLIIHDMILFIIYTIYKDFKDNYKIIKINRKKEK